MKNWASLTDADQMILTQNKEMRDLWET